MNIEKIKNYNQTLLAIIGTIAIIFALVGLILFIFFSITEMRRSSQFNDEPGILSEEKIVELQAANKREQVISYELPYLIDTINSIYIIPISHKTLNEPEIISGKISGLLNSGYNDESDQRYSSRYYGEFNNVIIYDQQNNVSRKLFNNRVNFNNFNSEYFSDDILLIFKVAEKDTYRDGVINMLDNKSLYIYSINEKKLRKINNDSMNVERFKFLNNSKDMIISFGIDKNANGSFEDHNEPTIIKKYNYQSAKLVDIVDAKTDSDLQKMLEGSKE
jgi:hypothetical protein